MTETELLGALLVVGLTQGGKRKAAASAAVSRKHADQLTGVIARRISKYWNDASVEAFSHLKLVLENNPQGVPKKVLSRPDIQEALHVPYVEAAAKSKEALRAGWTRAVQEALRSGRSELRSLGVKITHDPDISEDLLDSVLKDFDRNANSMRGRVMEQLTDGKPSIQRMESLTRDAPRRAAYGSHMAVFGAGAEVRMALAREYGVNRVWISKRDKKTCKWCRALHGVVVGPDQPFPSGEGLRVYGDALVGPPRHPNCLPGGTPIAALGVTGATARVFNGKMVRFSTRGGKQLSLTPNHPVLTNHGWVAAGLLEVGDHVVRSSVGEWELRRDQDDENMPALIEEVAESFLGSGKVPAAVVPTSPEDFHGDGAGSEVARVASDGSLLTDLQTLLTQRVRNQVFDRGRSNLLLLAGARYGLSVFPRVFRSPSSSVSGFCESIPLLRRGLLHAFVHRFRAVAGRDAMLVEDSPDGAPSDGVLLSQRLLALSGEVLLDEVTLVETYDFSGHVYNLETRSGWYISNSIVTHNCRCRAVLTLLKVTT